MSSEPTPTGGSPSSSSGLGDLARSEFAARCDAIEEAYEFVLAQPSIGSQLVDNLNASSHVRAVLTDWFPLDEALKP